MARNTGDVGATDRLHIDTNLLDPEREVIALARPNGEVLLIKRIGTARLSRVRRSFYATRTLRTAYSKSVSLRSGPPSTRCRASMRDLRLTP